MPGADPAQASGVFTFRGSGYGHGIGLSQYGALGLARMGWPPAKILRHFYTGVKVGRLPPADPMIRVGLLQNAGSVALQAVSGGFDLLLQSGQTVESVPAGARRTVEITSDEHFRVVRPDGTVVGDTTWGGRADPLVARPTGGRIQVPAWGHVIGRGEVWLEIAGQGAAHVVALVPVEEYVYGISEVPSSWPDTALRVQAIAARTYAYWRLAGGLRAGCACDVFSSVSDQTYTGWDKESGSGGDRWVGAVRSTDRTVVTYAGNPIYAAYSSSSGGHTEDIEVAWPGAQALPYLRGVCDPGDHVQDNPNRTWAATLDAAAVTNGLRPYTGDIGTVTKFGDSALGVSGRISTVRVTGTAGSAVVAGADVRVGLGLKSTRFAVNRDLTITGDIRVAYDRLGCRPGRATGPDRAVRGGRVQQFAVGRIYDNDRRNKVVWLHGKVLGAYVQRGAHSGRLGLPIRTQRVKRGTRGLFEGGTVTCAPGCRVRLR